MRNRAAWRAIAPVASLKPPGATGSDSGSSGPRKKLSMLLPTRAMPIAGWTATATTPASGSVVVGGVVVASVVGGVVVAGSLVAALGGALDDGGVVGADVGSGAASSVHAASAPAPATTADAAAVAWARNSRRV